MFDIFSLIKFVRNKFTKKDVILSLSLAALYLFTRITNLVRFPIFGDEGIYIHWAKVAWKDASWRFISLTDGKQPLQTWGTIPLLKLFPHDALFAGRLFSVITGFIALVGIFALLYYLFDKKTAFIGSIFYIFTPYFMFYDRMALVDSGVNAGFIWILFFSILLAKNFRLDLALIFGLTSGLVLLAKSSAQMFLGLSALAPILFLEKNKLKLGKKAVNYLILYGIAITIALIIYNIQRLSPFLHFVAEKNKTFIMTFDEFIKNPFGSFQFNIRIIPYYIWKEGAFFIPLAGFIGFFFLYKKDRRLSFYLFLWLIIPYIAISFFSKVLFPRYIIFFTSLLLVPASYLISKQNTRNLLIGLALFFIAVSYFDYTILFDFKNVPLPPIDRGQYVEGGTAGWGIKEIIEYARSKSQEKPVVIIAEGNFGVTSDILDAFLQDNDRILIKGYWPLDDKALYENQKELESNHVFVVFAYKSEYPQGWPIKLIKKFEKPGNKTAFHLFELIK